MNNDKITIISKIISLINSDFFDASILSLSEKCNIPVKYTRNCILKFLNNNVISECLDTDDDSLSSKVSIIEEFKYNNDIFAKKLLNGKYDKVIWNIDLKILNYDSSQILTLSSLEYGLLNSIDNSLFTTNKEPIFEIKNNTYPNSQNIRRNYRTIQNALINKKEIHFTYKDSKGVTFTVEGFPVDIFTNVTDNWIYFTIANSYTYRLDRVISQIKEIKKSKEYPCVKKNPYEKYLWGSTYNTDEKPIYIKLLISDINANIINKIKSDTQHRQAICKFYKKDNYYYYEDKIIGVDEFQRWLRSFGSSIQVIEPIFLKNKIIETANEILKIYKESDTWGDIY